MAWGLPCNHLTREAMRRSVHPDGQRDLYERSRECSPPSPLGHVEQHFEVASVLL